MSGNERTYVSVEENELRRLHEQESRLRTVNRDLPERLEAIRHQANQEIQDRLVPIVKRQREYELSVDKLQSDLGDIERETYQRISKQEIDFADRLHEQRDEYIDLIEEQEERNIEMIETERLERQEDIRRLNKKIKSLKADGKRKKEIAYLYLQDLKLIFEQSDGLPHKRFMPGGMVSVGRKIEDASGNLDAGMSDAALSTAQNAYWDLVDLRSLVLQKEREFMLLHQAALMSVRELLEEARANRKYELELGEKESQEICELEIDHWTRGELSVYEQELTSFEQSLQKGRDSLSIEQTQGILIKLDVLKSRIGEIIEHARQNIFASQIRANIAELAVDALKIEGFDIIDSAYEKDDERNAFVVKLKNIAGSEIVTVISPVKGKYGNNEVSIHSFDATYIDDTVYRQRSQEIVELLNINGFIAEKPMCEGLPDRALLDFSKVHQEGLKSSHT